MKFLLILPVKNPTKTLITICNHFSKIVKIIVVDDGSTINREYFNLVKKKVCLLRNSKNKGKGYSIKKAIKKIIFFKDVKGIIVADSDGQHGINDINKIIKQFKKNKNQIILGQRNFDIFNTPIRNYIGNKMSALIFFIKFKIFIDTQCGLRAIPIDIAKKNVSIPQNRYVFETIQLIDFFKNYKNRLKFFKIKTIYKKDNKSYFNFVKDSFEITNQFFK